MTPFGSLPILTVHDTFDSAGEENEAEAITARKSIPEADVIERFLAKRFGFMGSTADEELEICIVLSQTITIHNVWVFRVVPASAMENAPEARAKILQTFLDVTLRNWVLNCEKQLGTNNNNNNNRYNQKADKGVYLVGDKLSLADIKTAVLMDMLLAVAGADVYLNAEAAPGLWRLKENVDTLYPRYRAYRKSEAFRLQDEMTASKVVPRLEGFDLSRSHIFS